MNRALQFRAYDTIDKKWLFGYDILGGFNLIGEVVMMGELNRVSLERWKDIAIMQFTGLHDKNGTAIYEGDVVRSNNKSYEDVPSINYVSFVNGCFKLVAPRINDIPLFNYYSKDLEVIGDIFSHPELLTQ